MILQTPFLVHAQRMFHDGVLAGEAIENNRRLFADHYVNVVKVGQSHVDFNRHFDGLMDAIREEVEKQVEAREAQREADCIRYARKLWDYGKTYKASPDTIRRHFVEVGLLDYYVEGGTDRVPRGERDDGERGARAGEAVAPDSGQESTGGDAPSGTVPEHAVPERAQGGRSELRPDVLDHGDDRGHAVPLDSGEAACVRCPSCVDGRCAYGDDKSACGAFGHDGT